jgi:hypothetical protein
MYRRAGMADNPNMDGAEMAVTGGADGTIDLRVGVGLALRSVRVEAAHSATEHTALRSMRVEAEHISAEITALQLMIELVAEGRRRVRCARSRRVAAQRCGRSHNAARKA